MKLCANDPEHLHTKAIVECADCKTPLCRIHSEPCCQKRWCSNCFDAHRKEDKIYGVAT
jgi:hypothetical protein